MEKKPQPLKPIPTTRVWYKEFREIMNDKLNDLEQQTPGLHWIWGYDGEKALPFELMCGDGIHENFHAGFRTDGELFECVYGMLWGLEFKN